MLMGNHPQCFYNLPICKFRCTDGNDFLSFLLLSKNFLPLSSLFRNKRAHIRQSLAWLINIRTATQGATHTQFIRPSYSTLVYFCCDVLSFSPFYQDQKARLKRWYRIKEKMTKKASMSKAMMTLDIPSPVKILKINVFVIFKSSNLFQHFLIPLSSSWMAIRNSWDFPLDPFSSSFNFNGLFSNLSKSRIFFFARRS